MERKVYFKHAIKMAWPSVLESFFIAMAGLIDTYMVSALGSYAVAAVGLTNQPKFIGFTIFFAINVAVSALVARRKGERDKKLANEALLTAFVITMVLVVFITFIMVYYAPELLRFSGSNKDTHQPALIYFRILMGGMVFGTISMVINAAQRGSGNTQIAFTTNLVSSLVNILFNYLLIGGNFGFPKLGVAGAALATVLGTVVATIMSVRSLFKKDSFVQIPYIIKERIGPRLRTGKRIARLGVNLLVENLCVRVGFMTTALMAASLGTDAFASHNVGMNLLSLCFAFADGMQVAAVALTGSSLGAGKKENAKIYGKVCQQLGFIISVILSLILLIFGEKIFRLYFKEEHIVETGIMISRFMMIIALLQISQIIYGGCLRAAGDVKYTLVVSIISVTIIRTSVTYILVSLLDMGLRGIWLGILADQFSRFVLMASRFNKGKWVNIKI
ncbi:MATE family efflux transporter [Lagierella sp.]|uniref:MATE family efflux transporter n=1 Tax=Lagierella sp. TaxID=2849657 RepID=UPI002634637A|nr:MATE family efflux transporter [Lagierella sp.]